MATDSKKTKARLLRDAEGRPLKTIGTNQDITGYKRVETALRERERFISAVLENLPIGIAVNSVNPEVAFTFMNDNFPRFYGTTRQALTAHAMKGDREQFLDAGMSGYISKPVDMDDLARSLRTALDAVDPE